MQHITQKLELLYICYRNVERITYKHASRSQVFTLSLTRTGIFQNRFNYELNHKVILSQTTYYFSLEIVQIIHHEHPQVIYC